MATERFKTLYQFDLKGNYAVELERLSNAISKAEGDWKTLASAMKASGAKFNATKNDVKGFKQIIAELGEEVGEALPVQERLASSQKILADATNQLTRAQNRLNVVRARELQALEQARQGNDPQVIKARAETSALQRFTKALEKNADAREFQRLAAEAGLKVSADGKRLFDAEAVAMERAAKAAQELAVAEKLRQLGLDASGKPIAQDQPAAPKVVGGKLTQLGEQEARQAAQQKADKALIKARTEELLKQNPAYQALIESTEKLSLKNKQLTSVGEKTDGVFNRISFTFRRLIGIMAVFTVARTVVREFNSLIKSGIQFNASLETTRVGLAGFIAASAQVRDRFGNALNIDDQIIRSQNIAIDQMAKLRKDALETAASYDDLAKAFQTAVAPGLQANLTVDQIRKLTVNISQAATGLGLAQDQLAEEIRSIFQGTISARNTRIATALGISNEDVKRAKEVGNLFQFLDTRFAAISKTGKRLMDTFTGQLSNASDAFQQLLATSSQPLFEQLKAALRDVQAGIFEVVNDAVVFKPEKLEAFKALFAGLANGVQGIRAAFASIDPKGFAEALSLVGQTLGAIATGVANALTTAFNLASPLVGVISSIVGVLTKVVSIVRGNILGDTLSWVGQTTVLLGKFFIVFATLRKIRALLIGSFNAASSFARAMAAVQVSTVAAGVSLTRVEKVANAIKLAFGRLLVPVLLFAGAVAAIDLTFGKLFDFNLTALIGKGFQALNDQLDTMLGNVKGVKEEATEISAEGLGQVINDFRDINSEIQDLQKQLKDTFKELRFDLQKARETAGLPDAVAAQVGTLIEGEKELFKTTEKIRESLALQAKSVEDQKAVILKTEEALSKAAPAQVAAAEELLTKRNAINKALRQEFETLKKLGGPASGVFGDSSAFALGPEMKKRLEAREASEERYNKLKKEASDLDVAYLRLLGDQEKETGNIVSERGKLNALLLQQEDLLNKLKSLEEEQDRATARRLKAQLIISNLQAAQKAVGEGAELASAKAAFELASQTSRVRAEALQKEADLMKLRADFVVKELELRQGIDKTIELQSKELARGAEADFDLVASLQDQIRAYQGQLGFEKELYAQRKRRADFEARLAKLKETGGADQGIARGLEVFAGSGAGSDTAFEIGEKFGTDLATGLSETLGTALAETVAGIFDPNRNFDLSQAIGDLALRLGQDLFVQLVENLLAELIKSLGIGIGESLVDVGGAAAAGAAYAAPVTAAAEDIFLSSVLGASAMQTAAAAIEAAAVKLAIASGINIATGGAGAAAPVASAFGGPVKGFARGGTPHARRPLGIDARDTIPAWLRRGEWVIRPESVRKAERAAPGFMDLLNRGQINFDALSGIKAAAKGRPAAATAAPRRGFATGGAVTSRAPLTRESSGPSVVLQFNDEQTMDKALAAGSRSTIRFARANRQAYRSALGIDP